MKKMLLALLVLAALFTPSLAENEKDGRAAFLALTGLDEMLRLLETGVSVQRVYYTDGFGFSVSEFTTEDPEEISALLAALTGIFLGEPTAEAVTDWYPQIVFFLSDESRYNVCFNVRSLEIGGMAHFSLHGDEAFWALTAGRTAPQAP